MEGTKNLSGGKAGLRKNGLFNISIQEFCMTAVLMAMTCIATMFIQIPIPLGYAHLGDSVVLISAYFFGPVVGGIASGVGSALADLMTGYPIWALPTLLIKTFMPVIACAFFRKNVRKNVKGIFCVRTIAGAVVTLLFMTVGYVFFGGILYGSAAAGIASAPGLLIKSAVNLGVFLFVGAGLSKCLRK